MLMYVWEMFSTLLTTGRRTTLRLGERSDRTPSRNRCEWGRERARRPGLPLVVLAACLAAWDRLSAALPSLSKLLLSIAKPVPSTSFCGPSHRLDA
ncbi:unnamed protein product [Clonostachys rhizophaga]|uniref:Uncharacterized protein n=1 Tax=Clonostachys rhizophaga TaxID=160324 RepID=A0A9N9VEL5_9HYPO|nr:unnamed protein product [Clonostachys rhizophaga]